MKLRVTGVLLTACGVAAQFEVATIKPAAPDARAGRYITMQSVNRFVVKNYPLRLLIAAAYSVSPRAISGGPEWVDSDRYDILASTPGSVRPNLDEQMAMLRGLLNDRYKLTFHREQKTLAYYALVVAKNGPKLKESVSAADAQPALISTIFPDRVLLPARNATIAQFTSMMQRAVLDRPVVDKTGLRGTYDFDLEWAPDDTQFGGEGPKESLEGVKPGIFAAIQQQLGLRIEAMRGPVEALVIDQVERPSAN